MPHFHEMAGNEHIGNLEWFVFFCDATVQQMNDTKQDLKHVHK